MIRNIELRNQANKIYALIDLGETEFEEDDELRSHLAKYICILCSGFIENAVSLIYLDFIKREIFSEEVISFTTNILNKVQNPKTDKLREIAKSFNPEWERKLNLFLQDIERGSAINYIITERYKIAHGKDSDITLLRIKGYLKKIIEVFEFIENNFSYPVTAIVLLSEYEKFKKVIPNR